MRGREGVGKGGEWREGGREGGWVGGREGGWVSEWVGGWVSGGREGGLVEGGREG